MTPPHFAYMLFRLAGGAALVTLLASHSLAPAETLELELGEDSVILTWPGEELLFASPSLQSFSLVENAQSPFEQSTIGNERFFFQLRTLPQISVPIDGSVVGTELINVRGLVGTALAGAEDLTVTVNGQDAQISNNPEGELEFILSDFPLTEGLNSLTLVFSTSDQGPQTETRSVSYLPVVANNVVTAGDFAYAAQGVNGLAIVNLNTRVRTLVDARVDDLSFDGTFLFTLNTGSGNQALSVYSLADPANPVLISGPLSANTGFFSGVSAANGRVVVAGGTSPLSIRSYNRETGVLSPQSTNLDIALGHPDVLLSPDGELAYASVDFPGTRDGFSFGLATVSLNDPPQASTRQSVLWTCQLWQFRTLLGRANSREFSGGKCSCRQSAPRHQRKQSLHLEYRRSELSRISTSRLFCSECRWQRYYRLRGGFTERHSYSR